MKNRVLLVLTLMYALFEEINSRFNDTIQYSLIKQLPNKNISDCSLNGRILIAKNLSEYVQLLQINEKYQVQSIQIILYKSVISQYQKNTYNNKISNDGKRFVRFHHNFPKIDTFSFQNAQGKFVLNEPQIYTFNNLIITQNQGLFSVDKSFISFVTQKKTLENVLININNYPSETKTFPNGVFTHFVTGDSQKIIVVSINSLAQNNIQVLIFSRNQIDSKFFISPPKQVILNNLFQDSQIQKVSLFDQNGNKLVFVTSSKLYIISLNQQSSNYTVNTASNIVNLDKECFQVQFSYQLQIIVLLCDNKQNLRIYQNEQWVFTLNVPYDYNENNYVFHNFDVSNDGQVLRFVISYNDYQKSVSYLYKAEKKMLNLPLLLGLLFGLIAFIVILVIVIVCCYRNKDKIKNYFERQKKNKNMIIGQSPYMQKIDNNFLKQKYKLKSTKCPQCNSNNILACMYQCGHAFHKQCVKQMAAFCLACNQQMFDKNVKNDIQKIDKNKLKYFKQVNN